MIVRETLDTYNGSCFLRGSGFLYIPPHPMLRPYITNYTVTFPTPETMPDGYTVLPTASCTLTLRIRGGEIEGGLRGVNTGACIVGAHANKCTMLLLVEFRPGGLIPFLPVNQNELTDESFPLDELDKRLLLAMEEALVSTGGIGDLAAALDRIFLNRLEESLPDKTMLKAAKSIILRHGGIGVKELSDALCYSEKQVRRLFLRHIGTTPKTFSRIARANYALRLVNGGIRRFSDIAVQAGYFDESHFLHEIENVCGTTLRGYYQNMSVFYNDRFKM